MTGTTTVDGVALYWEVTGDVGPPVVLVHGAWGDHHGWDRIVAPLARACRVVTYDRRGHSRSERPAGQGSIREDVADLGGLIEHLGLAPAHIVGNSSGGSIVLRLAAERPEVFRSMLVHEPPLVALLDDAVGREMLQADEERRRAVLDLLEQGHMEAGARLFMETIAFGAGAWERFPAELRRTFVFNAATWLDEMREPDWAEFDPKRLVDFPAPILLTDGDQSEPFFARIVEKLALALPRARRHTLHGVGHVPQGTHPDQYVGVVESFIRGATSGAV